MVAPSWEEATGTPGELAASWGLPWGPPWPFPPELVLADGVLHPQDSSASLGNRHTHREREYRSLARRDPSHRETNGCYLCHVSTHAHQQTFLCRSSFLRCSRWSSKFSRSASDFHSSAVALTTASSTTCCRGSLTTGGGARLLLDPPCFGGERREGETSNKMSDNTHTPDLSPSGRQSVFAHRWLVQLTSDGGGSLVTVDTATVLTAPLLPRPPSSSFSCSFLCLCSASRRNRLARTCSSPCGEGLRLALPLPWIPSATGCTVAMTTVVGVAVVGATDLTCLRES